MRNPKIPKGIILSFENKKRLIPIIIYLFLTGANIGFIPAARKAGATGGTVIKGRLADIENIAIPENNNIDGEREILLILAPSDKYTGLRNKILGKPLVCF